MAPACRSCSSTATRCGSEPLARQRLPLIDDGATVADDPAVAVRGADLVLTVLFDADSVVEVLEQAADGLEPDTVVVQISTVGLDIDQLAEKIERLGVRLLDAPVLGTRQPAEQGTLTSWPRAIQPFASSRTRCSTPSVRATSGPATGSASPAG